MQDLSNAEIKNVNGGHPVLAAAAAVGIWGSLTGVFVVIFKGKA